MTTSNLPARRVLLLRRCLPALLAFLGLLPASLVADERLEGTTSAEARESAMRAIPYEDLDRAGREKVDAIVSNITIFRRMPVQVTRCDPDLYLFMVTHPDVTVNLWEVLGVSNVALKRTGKKTFRADDGVGTRGDVEFLYSSHDTQLIYTVGSYEGALFSKPVRGGCLMLLKTGYIREPDGSYYITSRLDCFFRIDHGGVELVTRTFQPLVGKSADLNFVETTNFLGRLSLTAEHKPEALSKVGAKMKKVSQADRDRFAEIVREVAVKARQLEERRPRSSPRVGLNQPGETLVEDEEESPGPSSTTPTPIKRTTPKLRR